MKPPASTTLSTVVKELRRLTKLLRENKAQALPRQRRRRFRARQNHQLLPSLLLDRQDDSRVRLLQSSQDLRQGKPPVVSILNFNICPWEEEDEEEAGKKMNWKWKIDGIKKRDTDGERETWNIGHAGWKTHGGLESGSLIIGISSM
ncbi:uncharacterized protein PADG_03826 [Paracoccidioides brasiliensis Pb18]|uniref:Uncharacterized protein n=1 Tax=Paracoccidioides brasiliensis (strain Pb18) TaxID=502780 RepID=C1G990_PARBD|nr:uncharacterized protein PADG_03826 [Paracoccidioides brasiliensis Pb18]EEH47742.2 hypothetical protein PADG_03826 [Paracoccidioides brasiliensis Pb18]